MRRNGIVDQPCGASEEYLWRYEHTAKTVMGSGVGFGFYTRLSSENTLIYVHEHKM
jgi:hypothetical protein